MNSASPVICRSGRTVTPGDCMSTMSKCQPLVADRRTVGAGEQHAPQRAYCATLVKKPPTCDAPTAIALARARFDRGKIGPCIRLGEALALTSSADRIGGRKRSRCSGVPWLMIVAASAVPACWRGSGREPARAPRRDRAPPHEHSRGPARPVHAAPAAVVEPPLPVQSELEHGVVPARLRASVVGLEPCPQLVAERELTFVEAVLKVFALRAARRRRAQ